MRFNAYFVRLAHSQDSFQGSIQLGGESLAASFRKINDDLFTVHFTSQVELTFRQKIDFKNVRGGFTVLLPVLSQYNQRKMKRLGELLAGMLPELIQNIPFPKSMRWGALKVHFARPIHWIVALLIALQFLFNEPMGDAFDSLMRGTAPLFVALVAPLLGEPLTPGLLAVQLDISPSALSFHLKELVHAGLAASEPDGRHLVYRANFAQMDALLAYLTRHCCQGASCEVTPASRKACAPAA